MWAFTIKDLKENGLWALIALVLLCGGLGSLVAVDTSTSLSLTRNDFIRVTMIAFPAIGGIAGMALVLMDRRTGRWGFAVHRPASRWAIFGGKFLAGAAMYGVATSAAVGVVTVIAMNPRIVHAPFSIWMLRPIVFYQLMGLLWLVTGMLVASRNARWIGTKLLPFGAPVIIMLGGYSSSFMTAMLTGVIAIIIMLPAAGGYFVFNGEYAIQCRWLKPIQAAVMAISLCLPLAAAMGAVSASFWTLSGTQRIYTSNRYILSEHGEIYRFKFSTSDRHTQVFDLSGKLLDTNDRADGGIAATPQLPIYDFERAFGLHNRFLFSPDALEIFRDVGLKDECWFFVPQRRTIEGLNVETGASVGSFGPSGFRGSNETPESFPEDAVSEQLSYLSMSFNQPGALIRARTSAYLVRFNTRRVYKIVETSSSEPICAINTYTNSQRVGPEGNVYVTTPNAIRVIKFDGEFRVLETRILRLPDDYRYAYIAVAKDGSSTVLAGERAVFKYDQNGALIDQQQLPTLLYDDNSRPWQNMPYYAATPPGINVALNILKGHRYFPNMLISLPIVWITALACVPLVVWICRRNAYGRTATITWIIATIFLGLCTPFLLISLGPWRRRVTCEACGRKRVIDRETCEHCRAAFARPSNAAIEIFEHHPALA